MLSVINITFSQLQPTSYFTAMARSVAARSSKKRKQPTPRRTKCMGPGCTYNGCYLGKHLAQNPECNRAYTGEAVASKKRKDAPEPVQESVVDDDDTFPPFDNSNFEFENDEKAKEEANNIMDQNEMKEVLNSGFTQQQFQDLKLAKLLQDANTPLYLYDEIKKWAVEAQRAQYNFSLGAMSRDRVISQSKKWLTDEKLQMPKQVKVTIQGFQREIDVSVTCFDFQEQLQALLSDQSLFGNIENLDVNPDNPFGVYQSPSGHIDCVNAGSWYKNTASTYVKTEDDVLIPIIFTYDETALSNMKTKIAPLYFTTSLLNQKCRNQKRAWKLLMYGFDLSVIQSKSERDNLKPEQKSQQRHDIFRAGMASYMKVEADAGIPGIHLKFGNHRKLANVICQVVFVSGDMQGGDNLCCCSMSYRDTLHRMCRKCNVPGKESGNPWYNCKKISMVKIKELMANDDMEKLGRYNQYKISSPWFEMEYGGDKFGIFSAAMPVEALHAVELGLIAHCLRLLWTENITNSTLQARFDTHLRTWVSYPRQAYMSAGGNKTFPRLLWKDGVTGLSRVTASEKVGEMLSLVVLSLTTEGERLFLEAISKDELKNMQEVFQMILCYWAWLKKETYWIQGDSDAKNAARLSICTMLDRIRGVWPRQSGQGWSIAKFHEQKHVVDDIDRHGPPHATNTHVTEHHHVHVKASASRTQGNREKLDKQLGDRQFESAVIDTAYKKMAASIQRNRIEDDTSISTEGEWRSRMATLGHNAIVARIRFDRHGKRDASELLPFICPDIIEPISEALLNNLIEGNPDISTERYHTFEVVSEIKWNNQIFRASNQTKEGTKWYDWAMIRYQTNKRKTVSTPNYLCYPDDDFESSRHQYAPGKCIGFLLNTYAPREKAVLAVLQMCDFNNTTGSVFTTTWKEASAFNNKKKRIPYYDILPIDDHFVRQCLMIPDIEPNPDMAPTFVPQIYHEVWPTKLWADAF